MLLAWGSPVEGKRKARSVAGFRVGEKLGSGPCVEQQAVSAQILGGLSFFLDEMPYGCPECKHRCPLFSHLFLKMLNGDPLGMLSQIRS